MESTLSFHANWSFWPFFRGSNTWAPLRITRHLFSPIPFQSESTDFHECSLDSLVTDWTCCPLQRPDNTSCCVPRVLTEPYLLDYWSSPLCAPVFTPTACHQTQYEFFKNYYGANNCGVQICINALKNTTMLRSPIVWHQLAYNHHAQQCCGDSDRIEKLSTVQPGVKEDFVIYLVSQAWKSMF